MASNKLHRIISETVKARLEGASIESITVTPDNDSDGEPILRITVVFETDKKNLDADKMVGLVRYLRSNLLEAKNSSFPLVSFVSKNEAAKLKLETA